MHTRGLGLLRKFPLTLIAVCALIGLTLVARTASPADYEGVLALIRMALAPAYGAQAIIIAVLHSSGVIPTEGLPLFGRLLLLMAGLSPYALLDVLLRRLRGGGRNSRR